eukprot:scaffold724_cov156-Isochrysis_galbana.AAC.2
MRGPALGSQKRSSASSPGGMNERLLGIGNGQYCACASVSTEQQHSARLLKTFDLAEPQELDIAVYAGICNDTIRCDLRILIVHGPTPPESASIRWPAAIIGRPQPSCGSSWCRTRMVRRHVHVLPL